MAWLDQDGKLQKTFTLNHFPEIISKLNEVALVSDALNHHPDVCIHEYRHVTFYLSTHSQQKITEKDHQLSRSIDAIFA